MEVKSKERSPLDFARVRWHVTTLGKLLLHSLLLTTILVSPYSRIHLLGGRNGANCDNLDV